MHRTTQRPSAAAFRIEVRPERDHVVVVAAGELDLATADVLETEVAELFERGVTAVTVDLRRLTFMDSSGLRLLIRLDERARTDGCAFALRDGEGPVRRLLELTRLQERFTMVQS